MAKLPRSTNFPPQLKGFKHSDLTQADGLKKLDKKFLEFVNTQDSALFLSLLQYRKYGETWQKDVLSEFLIILAKYFSAFIAELFAINDAVKNLKKINNSIKATPKKTKKIDYKQLVSLNIPSKPRQGFDYHHKKISSNTIKTEVNYCLLCHKKHNDFCNTGFFKDKKNSTAGFRKNPLNELLHGCPLEQRISESHQLFDEGETLAALIMIMRDNPMVAATGDRICNDCMKSCIYQKQTPVNIPQIESYILQEVLNLSWGVEIYDLLCKYNPLRHKDFLLQNYSGQHVLIVGMGPAGFTLAHYLTMQGTAVVGIDGLNITALPKKFINQPVQNFSSMCSALSEREVLGFGGVAEYGITSRWNKNFLSLIYLTLIRRKQFMLKGGVRFGGSLVLENIWNLGFQHAVLSVGAGLPKALPVEGSLVSGMRQAQDFLMNLHLSRAWHLNSHSDMLLRIPLIVIGGGLTAVDAATEARAYYIEQIKHIKLKFQQICKNISQKNIFLKVISKYEKSMLDEFLLHADFLQAGNTPDELFTKFGEVHIVYRKSLQDSPSYRTNSSELQDALAQGVKFKPYCSPKKVITDEAGWVQALELHHCKEQEFNTISAKTILVATGTNPNSAYAFEHKGSFLRDKFQYQRYKLQDGNLIEHSSEENSPKAAEVGFFTSYKKNKHTVSLIGDIHPQFAGSVVKAIASAKRASSEIQNHLNMQFPAACTSKIDPEVFFMPIKKQLTSKIIYKQKLANHLVHLRLNAPLIVSTFEIGQFIKIQYKYSEPLALIGFNVDKNKNEIDVLIWKVGKTSSYIAEKCNVDTSISVTGPLGVRTKLPNENKSMLIVGNKYVIPYLLSVGPEWLAAGKTIHAVIVGEDADYIPKEWFKNACSEITLLHDSKNLLRQFKKMLQTIQVDRVSIVADTEIISQIKSILHQPLFKQWLNSKVFASTYVPMQCMLKGVCAKCLVWQQDPKTNHKTKAVFACSWQDQPLQLIDLQSLDARLTQDNLMETLNRFY